MHWLTSTLLGTLTFEGSVDAGATWQGIVGNRLLPNYNGGEAVFFEYSNPQTDHDVEAIGMVLDVAAWTSARVRVSAYTSGSASAVLTASPVAAGERISGVHLFDPASGGAAGIVQDNLGRNALRVTGNAALDNPIGNGSDPLLAGAYASTATPAPVSADGDAAFLWSTRSGALHTVDDVADASLGIIDDWDESDRAKVNPIAGQAGVQGGAGASTALTQRVAIATDANAVSGTVTANLAAGSNNIGDVDVLSVPSPLSTAGNGTAATAHRVTLASDSTGQVAVASIAAGDNNIGNVDVVSLPALVAGTANIGDVDVLTMPNVTLAAGTNTNEVVGDIAHDTGVGGNPVLIAGAAQDMDDTAPPNRVSAESDTTRFATDRDGVLFAHPHGPQIWSYHVNGSAALTDASVHAAPAAGLSLYVTDIVVSSGAATAMNVFFEEGSTTVLGPYYLEAVNGRGLAIHFGTPKKITAATALTVTTSAAIAHSIDVTGFVGQG